jgi:hypothetical protein
MAHSLSRPHNVIFEPQEKEHYHALPARISRESSLLLEASEWPLTASRQRQHRTVLHQRLRPRSAPHAQPELPRERVLARRSSVFLWVAVDKVKGLVPFSAQQAGANQDLYDSIIPCLALQGIAAAIARSRSLRAKVLLREHIPFLPLATKDENEASY